MVTLDLMNFLNCLLNLNGANLGDCCGTCYMNTLDDLEKALK